MLPAVTDRSAPYPPSWIDRLHAWIDALPIPTLAVYLGAFLAVLLMGHAPAWAEGYVPVGSLDLFFSSPAMFLVLVYGAIHYLDRAAARAWGSFRPLVALDDEEAGRVAYELTTMPARPAIVCVGLGFLTAATYFALEYGKRFDLTRGPVTVIVGFVLTIVIFTGASALLYHSLRQLGMIDRVHGRVQSIDLLHPERLHAFASVTASTGVAILALGYIGLVTSPDALANPQTLFWTVLTTVVAVACFFGPLYGMHGSIVAEKARRLETVGQLLDRALGDLHRRVEQGDLSDADAVNKQVATLLAERDALSRAPTWPWSPGTLGGFVTAIALPIGLWIVYRFLGQVVPT
jgi:hypothetical protein